MRRFIPLAALALVPLAACQSSPDADDSASSPPSPVELGAALDVQTVAATTELAWSAAILPGTAAAVDGTVVYFGFDANGETVLTGAAADSGEAVWELSTETGAVPGTDLLWWVTPRPMAIEVVEVGGVPAVLARALDGDVGDCAGEESQQAVVAVEAATGAILWTSHPAEFGAEDSCGTVFEGDMVVTDTAAAVSGSVPGGGEVTVAMGLDDGEVLWANTGVRAYHAAANAIIGTRDLDDPASAGCELEREFAETGFDPATGEVLWELDPCEDPSITVGLAEHALVEVGEGAAAELRAIDTLTGAVVASIAAEELPDIRASDGQSLVLCSVATAEDAEALLLYDAGAAAFTVSDLEYSRELRYLIWQGHVAVYDGDADATRLYDLAGGAEAAEFPGWWAGGTGAYRLSTPPEYWSDFEAELDVYTADA
ncbi:outer membrane protein assembly factor BamB family protein [Glycomyces dulcitolivorans]|uniref:outer membrane protein assembly factor BamB family protein n=1 Tax=Glycomyces dulcitolivorans TaxID=2200759 RepID=UPI001300240F|nr:PQQ-binding-like beta-propeller repeat protein [Glycomyces dulcitolivorans]